MTSPRDLFLVANVAGAEWGVPVAKGIRDSILAEAAVVEDGVARKDSDSEKDMVARIASLSMSVSHCRYPHLAYTRASCSMGRLVVSGGEGWVVALTPDT